MAIAVVLLILGIGWLIVKFLNSPIVQKATVRSYQREAQIKYHLAENEAFVRAVRWEIMLKAGHINELTILIYQNDYHCWLSIPNEQLCSDVAFIKNNAREFRQALQQAENRWPPA